MFRTILVPLNGSRFAEAALPMASWLARKAWARLHLVLAHQPMAALVGVGELMIPPTNVDEELKIQEDSYLADTATKLVQRGVGPVEFQEVDGPAGPAVCQEATRLEADLVVMATHGRSAIGRLWLGSVAEYVVRHLSVPVLLVHPDRTEDRPGEPAIRDILVALDLSKDSEAILEPVTALAQLTQAHVTLIHAVERVFEIGRFDGAAPVMQDSAITEASRAQAQRQLDGVADRLRERGLSVSSRATIGLNAAGTLLDALEDPRFDVLAMTSHGAGGGIRRLFMGSVASQVLRRTSKPMLILRPPGAL